MKLLKEITNEDVGHPNKTVSYKVRKAARALLFKDNKIAICHVSHKGYYKLPGGGIEGDETIKQGLIRELIEETGCEADVNDEIGLIIEYRDDFEQIQFSYTYFATVTKDTGTFNLDQKEAEEGFKLIWVTLDEALKLVSTPTKRKYSIDFMTARDTLFLKEAQNLLATVKGKK